MIKTISTQSPEVNVSNNGRGNYKILIAYASQFGTTGEVAEAMADALSKEGNIVDTQWVKSVKDINNYDAVIIGSAIQYDKWMPEATDFVMAHQNSLEKIPVAYFFTCMTLSKRNEKAGRQAMRYSDKLYSLAPNVEPIDIGRFAGAVDYGKMSFFLRLLLGGMLSVMGVKAGDYRDWDAIRVWAKSIHLKLIDEQA